ncbi:MAG: recombinase [Gammaproteobacteria bacterium HGW-Gammaproteobacteria-14]|nr:MAG: recombinase [Gammaproteobacteria bacterium HGW-Gammaproteobacteria-14]
MDSPLRILTLVIDYVRPRKIDDASMAAVATRITDLRVALESRPELYSALSQTLRHWLTSANYFIAFASLGILPRQGFRRELTRRLYEQINPAPKDPDDVADMLALVFHHRKDPQWVNLLPGDVWRELFSTLWQADAEDLRSLMVRAIDELLYAMEMLSIWVAAEELEPDLVRLEPRLMDRDSAFVGLQRELASYVHDYGEWLQGNPEAWHDDAHARVMLDQCASEISFFRRRAVNSGTSIHLAYLLERLEQTLQRIEDILDIVDLSHIERSRDTALSLFQELVLARSRKDSLRALWSQNIRLLSRTVTENASDHGEHYVTRDRADYFRMLRSAAGAGLIIPLMALLKIQVHEAGLSEGLETLLHCLNYGLGFVLIHLCGFTIATKQPAMTAARFANAVEKEGRSGANARKLAEFLVQVSRSQFIAIVGNVALALSIAFLISQVYLYQVGTPLLSLEQQQYQQYSLTPFSSLALLHAGIAGVWLFLSGLIAGYFDNRTAYLSLEERFKRHPLLRRLLPLTLRSRMASYLAQHYGAIVGNFSFGVLLGATGYIGMLLGLPLDIRHVAFSSANLGYAGVSNGLIFLQLFSFVLMIGIINLVVSFALALLVALRARGVTIFSYRKLLRALGQEARQQPLALFWPPKTETDSSDQTPPSDGGKG